MSELHRAVNEYLALRRAMGFKLDYAYTALPQFIDFLERQGMTFITTALALEWATQPTGVQPAHWSRRLSLVRHFARHRSTSDPRTEIPPVQLLPYQYTRKSPYLYSDTEVEKLLEAASQVASPSGLRARTLTTLFGLLAATGLRISEALNLDRQDVDLDQATLTIRQTKCRKSRWLPLHATTQHALQRYAAFRDQRYPQPTTPSFFLSEQGTRVTKWMMQWHFVRLSRQIGLRGPGDSHGPRIHDMRHRFAIQTLLRWYREDIDVEHHLPELSTYLGHARVSDTFWYLSATPELLSLAAQRLEAHSQRPLS